MSTIDLENIITELTQAIMHIEGASESRAALKEGELKGAETTAQNVIDTAEKLRLTEVAVIVTEIKRVIDSLLLTQSPPDPLIKDSLTDLVERIYSILDFELRERRDRAVPSPALSWRRGKPRTKSSPYTIVNPRELDELSSMEWFHRDSSLYPTATVGGEKPTGVASRLLRMLKVEMPFVDRICITQRLGRSNELRIVDCAEMLPSESVTLRPGHRCFVSPNSTLFTLGPDTCRTFGDVRRVVSSFSQESRPAQRVLGTLERRGFRSGICLRLTAREQTAGFLFLNSRRIEAFSEATWQMNGLLAAAQAIARSAILRVQVPEPEFVVDLRKIARCTALGCIFHKAEFQGALAKVLPQFDIAVTYSSLPFLYSPEGIVVALAAILLQSKPEGGKVNVDVQRRGANIVFSVCLGPNVPVVTLENRQDLAVLGRWLQSVGVTLHCENGISISIPFDPAMGVLPWLPYSVYTGHSGATKTQGH